MPTAVALVGGVLLVAAMAGAVGVVVWVTRLHRGRSEDGKAGGDGQEGDDLFHMQWGFDFNSWPRQGGVCMRRSSSPAIQQSHHYSFHER